MPLWRESQKLLSFIGRLVKGKQTHSHSSSVQRLIHIALRKNKPSTMGGSLSTPPPSQFVLDPSLSETTPQYKTGELAADPNYGFEGKRRKERVMVASPEELESAMVPPKLRDYCAHKWIAMQKCKKDEFPWVLKCKHIRHEFGQCVYEDYIIRMKDYERERRLLHRKVRKEALARKHAAASADEE